MQFERARKLAARAAPAALALGLTLLWPALPAGAGDHDLAREALQRGEVRPVAEVLAVVGAEVPGEVIEVELEREYGRLVYELKVIAPDGRVSEVLVDAATAEIIEWEHD